MTATLASILNCTCGTIHTFLPVLDVLKAYLCTPHVIFLGYYYKALYQPDRCLHAGFVFRHGIFSYVGHKPQAGASTLFLLYPVNRKCGPFIPRDA